MNRVSLMGAVVLVALLTFAGLNHWRSDSNRTDEAFGASQGEAVKLESSPPANVERPTWSVDDAPAATASVADEVDAKIDTAAFSVDEAASEEVLGIKVKRDRNCTVTIVKYTTMEDGTQVPLYSCVPNQPNETVAYETYSLETLETMAYSDAHAAMVLSRKYIETDYSKAMDYGVRSAALSGDTLPLMKMLMYTPEKVSTLEQHLSSLKRRYVISGVIQSMDADSRFHQATAEKANIYEGDGFDFASLDREIADHVETLQTIKAEVGVD